MSDEMLERAKLFLTSNEDFEEKMDAQIDVLGLILDALENIRGVSGFSPTITSAGFSDPITGDTGVELTITNHNSPSQTVRLKNGVTPTDSDIKGLILDVLSDPEVVDTIKDLINN